MIAHERLTGIADESGTSIEAQVYAHFVLGWRKIELRTVGGVPVAELTSDERSSVVRRLRESSLHVVCMCSSIGNWSRDLGYPLADEQAQLNNIAQLYDQLGNEGTDRYVRIMSYRQEGLSSKAWKEGAISRISRLCKHANGLGLYLLHENCTGWASGSAAAAAELLREVDAPNLGLLFDSGNGLEHGYDSTAYLTDELLPHIKHVHVKDGKLVGRQGARSVQYSLPGEGDVGIDGVLAHLSSAGYVGDFSIEPHVCQQIHRDQQAHGNDVEMHRVYIRCGAALSKLACGR